MCYFFYYWHHLKEKGSLKSTRKDRRRGRRNTPPGSSSASTSGTPTRPKPSNFNYPNTVPVIFRDAEPKFTSVKQIMSELSQYRPEHRVSRVKDLPNKGFLIIENTPRDVISLQKENKMKACLDKNLNISPPKAYQNKEKGKTLVVKGVPTEFTSEEFKQVLDHNKIKHTKAERMKSRRDGRMLQMFQIELSDPVEAEAIISNKITCPQTGIIFKVEEFRVPISVQQCYNCQNFGIKPITVRQKLNVLSVEKATHTKDASTEKKATKMC